VTEINIVGLAPLEMVISLVRGDIDAFAWLAPFTMQKTPWPVLLLARRSRHRCN
jgi:ABC-type nitrate/sulfonate/bicarbonate transport system substrate-binding protein